MNNLTYQNGTNGANLASAITPSTPSPVSFELSVTYRGYAGVLTISKDNGAALIGELDKIIDFLEKKGITPAAPVAVAPSPAAPANDTPPVCEYHGPMKRSNKFSGWYCPKKMGDGNYCKSRKDD